MTSGDALRNRKKQKIVGYHYISDIMGRCRKFRENAGNTNFRIRNDGVGGSNPSCGTTIPSKDIQRSPKSLVYFRKIIDLLSNVVWPRPLTSGKFGGIFRGIGLPPSVPYPHFNEMPLTDTAIRNIKPKDRPFKLADGNGGTRRLVQSRHVCAWSVYGASLTKRS